jgi:hypothetical protein
VIDRGEVETIMWALADLRTDVAWIRETLEEALGDDEEAH